MGLLDKRYSVLCELSSMVKLTETSGCWKNSATGLYEDQFEFAVEDAALRLLGSLRDAVDSTCKGVFSGKCAASFEREPLPQRAPPMSELSGLLVRRRRALTSFGLESNATDFASNSGGTGTCRREAALVNVNFAPMKNQDVDVKLERPSTTQLLRHPLALLSYVPRDVALFFAGAVAGATAKTVTAPLDRIKLLMQVHGLKSAKENARGGIGFLEATLKIGKEEGLGGYWKGNFPQVIRIVPYSAVQLFAYELYKKLFKAKDKELSVAGRLAAGACAGMTSTLVTYPLDVVRLRLAVEPACKSMTQVMTTMLREEGLSSFYKGLGPSLLGIAPYIALNFCAFDLIKTSLPEEFRKTPTASFVTALMSATFATVMCYPLDTVRRQMQMRGTPYLTVLDAIPGIIARDGYIGLYRGFIPNALKNLPNSSIRLTTFDAAKSLISASQQEFQRLLRAGQEQMA